jgi:hypothetical protein
MARGLAKSKSLGLKAVFRELLRQFHSDFLDFLYVATLYYYAQSYGSRFLVFALRVPINVYFDICVLIWTRCHKMSHARDVGGVWLRSTLAHRSTYGLAGFPNK